MLSKVVYRFGKKRRDVENLCESTRFIWSYVYVFVNNDIRGALISIIT